MTETTVAEVMSTKFRDADGTIHYLDALTEDERGMYHYAGNRRHYGLAMFCTDCEGPSHILHRQGVWSVRHDPGKGLDCEYVDFYQGCKPGMSPEHREAAAAIALSIRKVTGWEATPERRFTDDDTGETVQPDVYAEHRSPRAPYQKPVVHEIQLSRQGADETRRRNEQRDRVIPSSRTFWWSPSADCLGAAPGVIINKEATRVIARAYSQIEPELIPMYPRLGETARRLIANTNRWVCVEALDGSEHHVLIPESAASGLPPRPPKPVQVSPEVVDVVERGCDRPRPEPLPAIDAGRPVDTPRGHPWTPPLGGLNYCTAPAGLGTFSGETCGLTCARGQTLCWRHRSDPPAKPWELT